jgi:hypothetical protein
MIEKPSGISVRENEFLSLSAYSLKQKAYTTNNKNFNKAIENRLVQSTFRFYQKLV